jgi:hypothetical protein
MFFGLRHLNINGEPSDFFVESYEAPTALDLVKEMIQQGGPFILGRTVPDYLDYVTTNYRNFLKLKFTFTPNAPDAQLAEEFLTQLVEQKIGVWEK